MAKKPGKPAAAKKVKARKVKVRDLAFGKGDVTGGGFSSGGGFQGGFTVKKPT